MAGKYRNGILSAEFGILQQLVTLIFGLIVPRLFIQTFGSEMNGLLSSLGKFIFILGTGRGRCGGQWLFRHYTVRLEEMTKKI